MGNSQGRPIVFTDQVQLEHFKLLRVVGKGAFGKVRIVERKDSGLTFALKYIRKDEVVRQENVRNIIRERKMLEHLNHPFLCNLRYSFQDYEYLYLVVDLMNGGDLRFHISRKCFEERAIRFWIAELGCALRYVHSQGIVHRDVKPDNVLLDSDGHIHLADFNVAADYTNPKRPLTSKSGTLAYLAPEVYEDGPYKCEVDWWSLGVLFYECVYGKRPFEARSHKELEEKIKAANPKFPMTEPRVDTACVFAIQRLMSKNLHDRIGANGFENFCEHPFFVDLNFQALEKKLIKPVFVPSSEKTNFDATYDLEELLLEEAPLEARARHMKPRPKLKPDATDSEKRSAELYEMIEKLFQPFDYTEAKFEKLSSARQQQANASSQTNSTQDATTQVLENIITDDNAGTRPDPQFCETKSQTPNGSPPLSNQASVPDLKKARAADAETERDEQSLSKSRTLGQSHSPGRTRSLSGINRTPTAPTMRGRGNTASAGSGEKEEKKSAKGIMAILSRRKDRGKSPAAAKRFPDGVLGKEGARVWIKDVR